MAKRRDYAAESARRNAKAQAEGWRNYSQKRHAKSKYRESSLDVQSKWSKFLLNKGRNLDKNDLERAFRSFWQGLVDPRTRADTSVGSPKSIWFVEYLDVIDYDEWRDKYAKSG